MKKLINYITENWKLKSLSFVLAVMLWFTVYLIGEMKKDIRVPITFVNINKEYSVIKTDMEKVDITIAGRVAVLKDIKDSDIKVTVSLAGAGEGENVFNLGKGNVEIPKGVQIGQIKPSSIRVDIEHVIEKRVKTVVKLDDRWATEYRIKSYSPQFVTVVGPRRIWGQRTFIETMPVKGNLRHEEETVQAPLNLEGSAGSKAQPDTITVTLRRHK